MTQPGPRTPQCAPDPEAPAAGVLAKKGVNTTAYRIFKLLAWLMESPLSVDELNERFDRDPQIARRLSSDSIWLYINTLKSLGCKIRRPSPRNAFRYELLYHPFGIWLDESDLDVLARVKAFGQNHLGRDEILVLDRFIKKVVGRSVGENPEDLPEARVQTLFDQSRSLDYEAYLETIRRLEGWITEAQLLRLSYRSPVRGLRRFYFLPEQLVYEQGVLYIRGDRPEYEDPSLLRIDRIQEAVAAEAPEVCRELLARRSHLPEVRLLLLTETETDVDRLRLDEGDFRIDRLAASPEGFTLSLQTRDMFSLRQRLLSSGLSFRVLAPDRLREELKSDLQTMLQYYESPEVPHGLV